MILEEFALLASDTARTKAYLQAMIREEKLPGMCIVFTDNISKMKKDAEQYDGRTEKQNYFDIDMPVLYSLDMAEIPYMIVEDKDINSQRMEEALHNIGQKYLIYSGYGGYILKAHLFKLHKKFIHIHAGILPQYRGSTTAYYSFLQEGVFGATAIFLNEGIDEGEIIWQNTFEPPEDAVDIDYIYEPFIRSRVLMGVIDLYLRDGSLVGRKQEQEGAETYFIIHPVLKHIALLGLENKRRKYMCRGENMAE